MSTTPQTHSPISRHQNDQPNQAIGGFAHEVYPPGAGDNCRMGGFPKCCDPLSPNVSRVCAKNPEVKGAEKEMSRTKTSSSNSDAADMQKISSYRIIFLIGQVAVLLLFLPIHLIAWSAYRLSRLHADLEGDDLQPLQPQCSAELGYVYSRNATGSNRLQPPQVGCL